MAKEINVHESCIVTKDDKGNLSLVGKAKEVLTSLHKHKVLVHILLGDGKKEDVEKFLNENSVPFASVVNKDDGEGKNAAVTVMPSSKVIVLNGDWKWCLDDIVRRLWGKKSKESPKSEQQAMDSAMDDYIKWASPKKDKPIDGQSID